ncbi:FAD-binding oxidoreductase [Deinococcus radiophilus]|uniref:D-lactate dehydrogenase (cytochrome) n=1 Tax=Deinococcus radiophilus TaxID=32062 RepID=A0A3S0I5F7_9DEIO|nr:FAD-binding oxidoreductase [Deinococcus radiophilus]RTR25558.1 FAD-binding oxidoreductase [Deinococcus radiophilus]UFA50496.1 FAD-binding oxidoreductase [Deinococcus radiophilus]
MPHPNFTADALHALTERFGERLKMTEAVREQHGRDESREGTVLPDAVLFAESEQDVVDALRLAQEYALPVVPWAAGSSLEGQLLPVQGGLSLDVSGLNQVLDVRPASFQATVQAGVTYPELNRQLRRGGLFFPVDPGAEASLGGMASTNASGTAAVRYGTTRDNILGLRVVLSGGEVLDLGSQARKTAAGYDLRGLFIGAEGTLGVITQLTVRLHPLPAHVAVLRAAFADIAQAAACAAHIMGAALQPERLELIDAGEIAAVNAYLGRDYPESPTLWMEFAAPTPGSLEETLGVARELCAESGGQGLQEAHSEAERAAVWEARHKAYYAITAQHPGHAFLTTDLCVPLEYLPELVAFSHGLAQESGLDTSVVGHVGDGNFHVTFHAPAEDAATWQAIHAVYDKMVTRALAAGGTCTGEHGVGLHKRGHLAREHGPALPYMRAVKAAFDPLGIMNPGKIF